MGNENVGQIPYSSGIPQPNFISRPPPSDITFRVEEKGRVDTRSIPVSLSMPPALYLGPSLPMASDIEGRKKN